MEWQYLQIYFGAEPALEEARSRQPALCDELLTDWLSDCLAGAVSRGWLEKYFFVRYLEGGYHLRLRLKGRPELLRRHLLPGVERALVGFFRSHAALLPPGTPPSGPALEASGLVRRAPYEPELAKYGGGAGLSLAEDHFQVSSEAAVRVLENERRGGAARARAALEMIYSLLRAYAACPGEQAFVLKSHTGFWMSGGDAAGRRRALEILESNYERQRPRLDRLFALHDGVAPGPAAQNDGGVARRWREHLREHISLLKQMDADGRLEPRPPLTMGRAPAGTPAGMPTIAGAPTVGLRIVPNYIHMLCNRLGLSIPNELQLTHLLYRHIEHQLGAVSASCRLVLEP